MPETQTPERSDTTFPSLPIYWRRVLAVSLSDLEEEIFISLHHPLQPERVLDALSHHARLIRGLIKQDGSSGQNAGCPSGTLGRPLPPARERAELLPLSDLRPDIAFVDSPKES